MTRGRGGHRGTWLVANGENGETYYAYCRVYSDAFETSFKQKVFLLAGGCRSVRRANSEPGRGHKI